MGAGRLGQCRIVVDDQSAIQPPAQRRQAGSDASAFFVVRTFVAVLNYTCAAGADALAVIEGVFGQPDIRAAAARAMPGFFELI